MNVEEIADETKHVEEGFDSSDDSDGGGGRYTAITHIGDLDAWESMPEKVDRPVGPQLPEAEQKKNKRYNLV